jgi:RNA polymerase sigma factor (sigma-70 family)
MINTELCLPRYLPATHLLHKQDLSILLDLARTGDEGAFTILVRTYEPGLRRTAKRVLGHLLQAEVDTEDLVQSVHWSLWVGLREGKFEFDSPERLLAGARAILRGKVARLWRTIERRRRLVSRIPGSVWSRSDFAESDQPERQISAEDQFEHLCKMMTWTERRLIELRILGYTTAEAAREMGRDTENLRVTLARLRKKLRDSGMFPESRKK